MRLMKRIYKAGQLVWMRRGASWRKINGRSSVRYLLCRVKEDAFENQDDVTVVLVHQDFMSNNRYIASNRDQTVYAIRTSLRIYDVRFS